MFDKLVDKIHAESANVDFKSATENIREFVNAIDETSFKQIVRDIGTIPESIEHDSTEEKLYSKASDIVLARCFRLLGLSSKALDERADSADIIAKSKGRYNYSLVADAKCFRLSRTAKNQKDFKVSNLSDWRGSENEYAVLVAPYFQYPQKTSQIYSKALEHNVCLLSWEHISILLNHGVKENDNFSLESIWDSSRMIARDKSLAFSNAKKCFLPKINFYIAKKIDITYEEYIKELNQYKNFIVKRGESEIEFWKNCISEIQQYSREKAIEELLKKTKMTEKIATISVYINKLDDAR